MRPREIPVAKWPKPEVLAVVLLTKAVLVKRPVTTVAAV
jgi:hypothetical protein